MTIKFKWGCGLIDWDTSGAMTMMTMMTMIMVIMMIEEEEEMMINRGFPLGG